MSKQLRDVYVVAATRTPIGKSGRGMFKNTRPDDLLVATILLPSKTRSLVAQCLKANKA